MSDTTNYNIDLEIKYAPLEKIDLPEIVAANTKKWMNQTLTEVNDSVVRLGIVEGEFHWHKHDDDDEFFYVVDGLLQIEVEGHDTIELGPQQGVTIPKGMMHRPIAPIKTVMLMVETNNIQPEGD